MHGRKESHERTGPLGKIEPIKPLVAGQAAPAADHVPHVELGELVISQVHRGKAMLGECLGDFDRLIAVVGGEADENVRLLLI